MSKHPFVPAYVLAGYKSYQAYLESKAWDKTKWRIYKRYPKSRYCYVCDSTKYINLHHENYWAIPKERLFKDVVYLCQRCHMAVHSKVGKSDNPLRTVLEPRPLQRRREELRKEYIRKNLRPSTCWHFFVRFLYRLFW